MAKNLIQVFDYESHGIDTESKGKLENIAARARGFRERNIQSVIAEAEYLASARSILATHRTGVYVAWLEQVYGMSKSTAYKRLRIFDKKSIVHNVENIELAALYELTKDDCPSKAILEANKLTKQNKVVTHAVAKKLIEDATVETPAVPAPEVEGLAEPVVEAVETGQLEATEEQLEALADYDAQEQVQIVEAVQTGVVDMETVLDEGLPETKPKETSESQGKVTCVRCGGTGEVAIDGRMPAELAASSNFVNSWQDWVVYKTQSKKKLTTASIARQFNLLKTFGPDKAIRSIEMSIQNGYTGLFDPDQKKGKPDGKSDPGVDFDPNYDYSDTGF